MFLEYVDPHKISQLDEATPAASERVFALGYDDENPDAPVRIPMTSSRTVEAEPDTPRVLTADESGLVLTNAGATAEVVVTLPSAVAGLTFEFAVLDTDGIKVTAAAGDAIRIDASVTSAAGTVTSTTVGDTLRLVAVSDALWVAMGAVKPDGWTVSA